MERGPVSVRIGRSQRLWNFHTIPKQGEFGYDTWLEASAEYNGNTGAWAQMSADPQLGLTPARMTRVIVTSLIIAMPAAGARGNTWQSGRST